MKTTDALALQAGTNAIDRSLDRGGPRAGAPGREELARLAQEFEATLMNEMLSGWRQSLLSGDEEAGTKTGVLSDMVGTEFGRALSRSGGFGIADVLIRALQRQYGRPETEPSQDHTDGVETSPGHAVTMSSSETGVPAHEPSRGGPAHSGPMLRDDRPAEERPGLPHDRTSSPTEGSAPVVSPLSGVVTSGFGWRSDPIDGRMKFHRGADLRMAYGREVSTVASGRVTFAGERAGYGLAVVVDHGDGLETRYAHLSSTTVKAGDTVSAGGVIARSGNSGRSTGPHLHVELVRHGRPVDPLALHDVWPSSYRD